MGKATRWLKGLLGIKRSDPNSKRNPAPTPLQPHTTTRIESRPKPSPNSPKEKRRWSFVKSYREKSTPSFTSRPHADSVLVAPQLRSQSGESPSDYSSAGGDDPSKHAIAVAAASAAAADAAVAAAKAAAAVVRLTSSGRSNNVRVNNVGREEEAWAALVIQSHFRGYLARRALRALKGLVKLQALVRGHIMRKKASETMRCMQAMLRAQARARADRGLPLLPSVGGVSPHSSGSKSTTHPGPPTPEKFERAFQAKIANRDQSPLFKRNSSRSSGSRGGQDQVYYSSSLSDLRTEDEHPTWDQHRGDKILEIDPGKPGLAPPKRRKNLFETSSHSGVASDRVSSHLHSCTTSWDSTAHQQATISPTSVEVVQQLPPLNPLKFAPFTANNYNHLNNEEDGEFCTAENSPQFYSVNSSRSGASSRRGFGIGAGVGAGAAVPYTPTKSDGSFSGLSGYSDCPSYMACTESSRAKMRSLSAPRQRPNYEQLRTSSSSTKRWSAHHHGSYGDAGRSSTQIIRGSDHHLEVPTSSLLHYAGYVAASGGKAYPGSGRLDRLGMPVVKDNTVVYYSGYLN